MDHADTSWFHVALPKRRFLQWSAAAVTLAALSACSGGDDDHPPDIVELAKSEPDLSILVEAVVAAGLVDTLKSPGPFTVFAPTNAAFAALLTELKLTKEQLLANKPLLTAVLTYQVLAAKVMAANIASGKAVTTVQGGVFKIDTANGAVITDGRNRTARIVRTDIAAVTPKEIVDPTGVGDAFRAGLLRGVAAGWPWPLCGQVGALAATYCLEHNGPQSHHYSRAEFLTRFRQHFDDAELLNELF